ncbi:MAG: TM0106 family RecB-like putative nuclease [Chryseolinea sp.]
MEFISNTFQLAATDLSNHLSCFHLTQLNRKVALGELKKPYRKDPSLEILAQRGREHETAFVEYLKAKGLTVSKLQSRSVDATIEAMNKGVDVIVQARLENGQWMGYADVLLKVDGKSKFGDWSYEVYDTKLSQTTRAEAVLQLCLYSDLLSAMQECVPERMYVVRPVTDFIPDAFRFAEFQSYYRLVKKNLTTIMDGPALASYPDPVQHCDVCNWWPVCDRKRHDDDYLSLVAGIRKLQIEELQKQNILTLESFAKALEIKTPDRGNKDSFLRRQAQARVQWEGRSMNQLLNETLPIEKDRGLNRLPEPNAGDIYFDIEGDPFYPDGGLEYMLGYAYRENNGILVYRKQWATNRVEEKRAFQLFMDFVVSRWKQFPDLHIYHFAPYEPSAVKRLASVHAIFEQEVDELLRAERFVDLHMVFKEAFLASVERYSLKTLEKFTTYTRKIELEDASVARKHVECALELNDFNSLAKETIENVELYNEDDCLATEALHAWLEDARTKLIVEGKVFERPTAKSQETNDNLKLQESRSQKLFEGLTHNLPDDRSVWSNEDQARWLLAHQIDYFRREDKTVWWEHFRVHKMEYEDLLDERKGIAGLQFVEVLPLKLRKKTPTHRYKYPPQEIGLSVGDGLIEINSQSEEDKIGREIGSIETISLENYTIDIKKKGSTVEIHPSSIHVYDRIDPGALWTSLMNLAATIDEEGLSHQFSFRASKDLLMNRKPKLIDGNEGVELLAGEDVLDGAIRIALNLDRSILPIQGPPGTGKTHAGAKMIIELVKAKKKIGVTAISHRVVTTLLEKVKELADQESFSISFAHKVSSKMDHMPAWINQIDKSKKIAEVIEQGMVVGGTAWLWSDDDFAESLDYLFIDEAGQMSLSQALAASRASKNIILLGDPQQLEQPQRGAHPEGSDVAALTYLLEGHPTMPEGKGLFLGVTRRMHPKISQFTSEVFYEGKLTSSAGLEKQLISGGTPFDGAGLFYVPVVHSGNQNNSPDEVDSIKNIVELLLTSGKWTDAKGNARALTKDDILIVAPYNAQVAALSEKIHGVQIGTVDKFQGKEAPVVIYSMTSSTVQDAPRGMTFLFSPNRLNVATSRARSVCVLVASPLLMEPECHTIDQMKWANGLCRYLELARKI